ncbi:RNA polymerase sigma factor [Peribacillus tepidiphilus]|uniref:RNA polymerase sigma factor n=1 Tax=Peribacillus tepidiphilus TaxID=2652445 RepID=UPI0035B50D73
MEDEIIIRAKNGDKQAINQVIIEYAPVVEKFSYQMGNSKNDIDDITQEVFIKIFRFIHQFSHAKFTTWLYKITLNVTKDYYRKQKRNSLKLFKLPSFQREDSFVVSDDQMLMDEQDHTLHNCILALDEKYRVPIILHYFHDCKYEEIAEILGLNLSTVKTRLLRAKELLRKKLEQEERKEGGSFG